MITRFRIDLRAGILLLRVICLLALSLSLGAPLRAQESMLAIREVDVSDYPTIRLTVEHANLTEAEVQKLVALENGQRQQLDAIHTPQLRIGVLFDSYREISAETFNQLADAIDELNTQVVAWPELQLALFTPNPADRALTVNLGWKQRLWREITNGILRNHATTRLPKTPLKDLIADALGRFGNGANPQNHLIVLTDGFDKDSSTTPQQLTALMSDKGVQLYFVNYEPDTRPDPEDQQLDALAQALGVGPVTRLGDRDSLLPVWRAIVQTPQVSELTYTAQRRPPFSLGVQTTHNGQLVASAAHRLTDYVPPVEMTILRPTRSETITTKEVSVVLQFSWPVGYPSRKISRIKTILAGGPGPEFTNPDLDGGNQFPFTLADLPDGQPLLSVTAYESIDGFDTTTQTRLNVSLPPAPTPAATPMPTPTTFLTVIRGGINRGLPPEIQIPESVEHPPWWLWPTVWTVGLILVLVQIPLLWRRLRRLTRRPIGGGNVLLPPSTHDKTTDQWSDELSDTRAELLLIQGEGALPGVITLRSGKTIFGRNFTQVDELLASRYVSQSQFTIWERNGSFVITNNTIRNRTFVNDKEIPSSPPSGMFPENGYQLKSRDVIRFGPFKYRFLISNYPVTDETTRVARPSEGGLRSPVAGRSAQAER